MRKISTVCDFEKIASKLAGLQTDLHLCRFDFKRMSISKGIAIEKRK
jgi:hypothetical protein